ncbi:hypothetical protein E4U30_004555 [Claviceps sp. LM220 group G6]|nr:hypothetical protein E4U15_004431 [Claviceps sp. LM218 group G6]KAG6093206.1 hypothetical protein E4U30_004555 [Claviceps sp. LM220 group G6]KAG6111531.1 hypothetical protein E4U14_002450 [Claviceps sp. LM454 group G7]KAG6114628.1 hypothetical protein E4U31_002320 [Claviceps sp. LM219 group G6]
MVQITSFIVAVIVAVTHVAQAADCTPGLLYCGDTLLHRPYDSSKILQAIQDAGLAVGYWQNILIQCNPDESITALKVCDGLCANGGEGNSDYCTN